MHTMTEEQRILAALNSPPPVTHVSGMEDRPESDIQLGELNQNPTGMSFWGLIGEDYQTHDRDVLSQGFWAIAVHRLGNWRMGIRNRFLRLPFSILYKLLYKLVEWLCGISLAYTVKVGRRVHIWHHGGMILGALEIGNDVNIRQNTTFGVKRRGDPRWMKPIIGDRCDIGCGAVIVGPVTIGHDSVIGANVVIAKDVPANTIVTVGQPVFKEKKQKANTNPPQSHRDTEKENTENTETNNV